MRPITVSPAIANSSYSLKCVGAHQESNIQWTKNWKPLSTSDRVHLADNKATLSFDPLHQSDAGVYACIVSEQGKVIPGISHELKVICEYTRMHYVVEYVFELICTGPTHEGFVLPLPNMIMAYCTGPSCSGCPVDAPQNVLIVQRGLLTVSRPMVYYFQILY